MAAENAIESAAKYLPPELGARLGLSIRDFEAPLSHFALFCVVVGLGLVITSLIRRKPAVAPLAASPEPAAAPIPSAQVIPAAPPQPPHPAVVWVQQHAIFSATVSVVVLLSLAYYVGVARPRAREFEAIRTVIAAFPEDASSDRLNSADEQVKAYLRSAPDSTRAKVEALWKDRNDRWETHRLSLARGSLRVTSEATGAMVRVDDLSAQPSQANFPSLTLGKHTVVVSAPGYDDWKGQAEIKENQLTDLPPVALVRQTGSVTITSDPAGATFVLEATDGEEMTHQEGTTPAKFDSLPTGKYQVTGKFPGLGRTRAELEVKPKAVAPVALKFPHGGIKITSQPVGANVVIDGTAVGKTPYARDRLPPGEVEVTLRQKGYQPKMLTGTIAAGKTLELQAALTARPVAEPRSLIEDIVAECGELENAELRMAVLNMAIHSVALLKSAPHDSSLTLLEADLAATREVADPMKRMQGIAFTMEKIARIDLGLSAAFADEAVRAVPQITGRDDQHTLPYDCRKFWMHPDQMSQMARAMDGYFTRDDWLVLTDLISIHAMLGDTDPVARFQAMAGPEEDFNIMLTPSVVAKSVREGANRRQMLPIRRLLLEDKLAQAQAAVANLQGPLEFFDTLEIAEGLIRLGDKTARIELVQKLEENFQDGQMFFSNIAAYELACGHPAESASYAVLLPNTSQSNNLYCNIALFYLRHGDKKNAAQFAARLKGGEAKPGSSDDAIMAKVFALLGNTSQAQMLEQRLAFQPTKENVWLATAAAPMYEALGDTEKARQALEVLAQYQKTSLPWALEQCAETAILAGRPEEARRLAEQAEEPSVQFYIQVERALIDLYPRGPGAVAESIEKAAPGMEQLAYRVAALSLYLEAEQTGHPVYPPAPATKATAASTALSDLLRALQGSWEIVSVGGQELPEDKRYTLVYEGSRYRVLLPDGTLDSAGQIRLGTSGKFTTYDVRVTEDTSNGPHEEKSLVEIVDGRLRLCSGVELGTDGHIKVSRKRPTSFTMVEPTENSAGALVLEAVRKGAAKPHAQSGENRSQASSPSMSVTYSSSAPAGDRLEGEWEVSSANGETPGPNEPKYHITISGERITIGAGSDVMFAGTYQTSSSLDGTAQNIDITLSEAYMGSMVGKVMLGLIDTHGTELALCLGKPGGQRPASLEGNDSGSTLRYRARRGSSAPAQPRASAGGASSDPLQGAWVVRTVGGQPVEGNAMIFRFEGDRWTMESGGTVRGHWTYDPSQSPMTIDFHIEEGSNGPMNKFWPCLIEVTGDRLRLATSDPSWAEPQRPKGFINTPDGNYVVFEMVRSK